LGERPEIGTKTRILVAEVSGGALGLVVDNVDGILPIPAEQIEPLPSGAAENGLGEEVAAVCDRLIVLSTPSARSATFPRSVRRPRAGAGRAPRRRAPRPDRRTIRSSRGHFRRRTATAR
jgi:hypothetical protein